MLEHEFVEKRQILQLLATDSTNRFSCDFTD